MCSVCSTQWDSNTKQAQSMERCQHCCPAAPVAGQAFTRGLLQGFVQFRVRGDPVHLDVDKLNEQLQAAGKTRLRQFMRPDEALGVIISFDNVVSPTHWSAVPRVWSCGAWLRSTQGQQGCHFVGLSPSHSSLLQIADLRGLQRTAWMKVASDEGLPFPRLEHHVYNITPERAIMQVGMHAGTRTSAAVIS